MTEASRLLDVMDGIELDALNAAGALRPTFVASEPFVAFLRLSQDTQLRLIVNVVVEFDEAQLAHVEHDDYSRALAFAFLHWWYRDLDPKWHLLENPKRITESAPWELDRLSRFLEERDWLAFGDGDDELMIEYADVERYLHFRLLVDSEDPAQ